MSPPPSQPPSTTSGHGAPPPNPDRAIRKYYNTEYPKELWYFIGSLILVVAIFQLGSFLLSKRARLRLKVEAKTEIDPENVICEANRSLSLRRLPLALVNAYRIAAFRCTVSIGSYTLNFAEVFLTVTYIVIIFTWSFVNTTTISGHKLDMSYWSNRAGTLAASQMPLITALGTKNNIVALITGLSYDKLNYLHRMTARIIMVLLWTHGGGRIYQGLDEDIHETFLHAGLLAVSAFSVLCIVSLRPIRAASYEIFFYAHFALILILLIGAYFHTRNFKMASYIWPSFIVWGLDRLIRAIRLVLFNHSYFGLKSGSGTMDASTELLSDHLVRLTMNRPPHFHWAPGQTAYLILPSVSSLPFEAHPFTIASLDSSLLEDKTATKLDEKALGKSAPYWKELVFLINVRDGFTKRLKEISIQKGKVKTFIDGPYGPSPNLSQYDTSVLIAGGSGVSYTLPVLLNIFECVRNSTSDCSRVLFVWSVRDISHVQWISNALSKALILAPSSLQVDVRIHITGSAQGSISQSFDDDSDHSVRGKEEKDTHLASVLDLETVKTAEGRPDIRAMLLEEVESTSGRMSVSVCGSQGLASAVRCSLKFPVSGPTQIMKGRPSVTLHVESFGYA